jgi:hypothetical protein
MGLKTKCNKKNSVGLNNTTRPFKNILFTAFFACGGKHPEA